MHQVIAALKHTWHILHQTSTPASPEIIQRSLAIVLQLKSLSTHAALTHALSQLQKHLEHAHLHLLLMPMGVEPSSENTPWLTTTAETVLPSSLETMGSHWRNAIQHSKAQPKQRLALAIQMLPYSTAFTEAAIALRAILREKTADADATLQLLYWLAAIHSFISLEPETPSGDKVATAISGSEALTMNVNYANLGTEALPLLNITDKNLIEKTWGSANQQQSLNVVYPKAWHAYKQKLER